MRMLIGSPKCLVRQLFIWDRRLVAGKQAEEFAVAFQELIETRNIAAG